jgi:hypothetical protein
MFLRSHQERDAKPRDRYHAVVLALEGYSARAIARMLARPRHRKNDPAQMQQGVEQAPLLSRPRPNSTPDDKSKSGSRMRPGSASKEP